MTRKTKTRWSIAVAALAGLYFAFGTSASTKGDQAIAKHFEALCGVAKKNIDSPRTGVEKLSRYFGDHSPTMMKSFGDLLVEIERIEDDGKHDARAREAAKVMQKPLLRCQPTFERFFAAVERDPQAKRLLERRLERLGRTLEILFGAGAKGPLLEGLRRATPWLSGL